MWRISGGPSPSANSREMPVLRSGTGAPDERDDSYRSA